MIRYVPRDSADKLKAAIALGYIERLQTTDGGYLYRLTNLGRIKWAQEIAVKNGFVFK